MPGSTWLSAGALTALAAAGTPALSQELAFDMTGLVPAAPAPDSADSAARAAVEPDGERSKGPKLHYALLDRLEWAPEGDSYSWDFSGLFGGETNRIYFGTSADGSFAGRLEYLELDLFYSRNAGGGLELNAGLRADLLPSPNRFYGAVGAQLEQGDLWAGAWAYLSDHGELSARLAAYYNLKVTGRLVVQPSFELNAYGQDIDALGIGSGLAYAEAGVRIRYEIIDHFAPYVGLSWERALGRTARIARTAGEEVESATVVVGVRSEF
jgi:copper resistance protein B